VQKHFVTVKVGSFEITLSLNEHCLKIVANVWRFRTVFWCYGKHPRCESHKMCEYAAVLAVVLKLFQSIDHSAFQYYLSTIILMPELDTPAIVRIHAIEIKNIGIGIAETMRPDEDLQENAAEGPDVVWTRCFMLQRVVGSTVHGISTNKTANLG
jgi:hypothetical protein